MSVHNAIKEINRVKGTQLDDRIVEAFIEVAKENNYFKNYEELELTGKFNDSFGFSQSQISAG